MTSVLDAIVKLPRFVKIRSTSGEENNAVVSKGYLAIDPKHEKLLTSMRTVWANELALDKNQTSYNDLLDDLRLGL